MDPSILGRVEKLCAGRKADEEIEGFRPSCELWLNTPRKGVTEVPASEEEGSCRCRSDFVYVSIENARGIVGPGLLGRR